MKEKDSTWKNIMMDALFLGMISAFVGYVVAPVTNESTGETYISLLAILVLLTSGFLIIIFGLIIKKYKQEWLKNYALPISMIASMALALVYALLGVR
jgi:cytochrome b subunit of formate dehydrogenase